VPKKRKGSKYDLAASTWIRSSAALLDAADRRAGASGGSASALTSAPPDDPGSASGSGVFGRAAASSVLGYLAEPVASPSGPTQPSVSIRTSAVPRLPTISAIPSGLLVPENEGIPCALDRTVTGSKIRVFTLRPQGAAPEPNVIFELHADIVQEDCDPRESRLCLGLFGTDHMGYASIPVDIAGQLLKAVKGWSVCTGEESFEVLAHLSAVNRLVVHEPRRGRGLPGILEPDASDWRLSPASFIRRDVTYVGQGGCEELLPSTAAIRAFPFSQLIRKGLKPAMPEVGKFISGFPMLLEYETTWAPLGHALGEVVYSLPLAPCESVNVAIIDWSRTDSRNRHETTGFAESMNHNLHRERGVEEAMSGAISEMQEGSSTALAAGASGGFGPFSASASMAHSFSSSSGRRDIASQTAQKVDDRIGQSASAMRRLNSTVVVSGAQAESDRVETRTVTNHNHCHAMTVLYYEVMRHFVVRTSLKRVLRVALVDLTQEFLKTFTIEEVFGHRHVIEAALLDRRLADVFRYRYLPDPVTAIEAGASEPRPGGSTTSLRTLNVIVANGSVTAPVRVVLSDGRSAVGRVDGRSHFMRGSVHKPGTTESIDVHEDREFGASGSVNHAKLHLGWTYTLELEYPIPLELVQSVTLTQPYGSRTDYAATRIEAFAVFDDGTAHQLVSIDDVPDVGSGVVNFPVRSAPPGSGDESVSKEATKSQEAGSRRFDRDLLLHDLMNHINSNVCHYRRALWLSDDCLRASTLRAEGLQDSVENRVVWASGYELAFPIDAVPIKWLDLDVPRTVERIVGLPTRGIFAEAKLGSCNSCEQIDDSRYWDWSGTDCDRPPAIGAIAPGSRATSFDAPRATEMPAPVATIQQAPEAPDPTGIGAALDALTKSDVFRDMSGKEGVAELAGKAMESATSLEKTRLETQARVREEELRNRRPPDKPCNCASEALSPPLAPPGPPATPPPSPPDTQSPRPPARERTPAPRPTPQPSPIDDDTGQDDRTEPTPEPEQFPPCSTYRIHLDSVFVQSAGNISVGGPARSGSRFVLSGRLQCRQAEGKRGAIARPWYRFRIEGEGESLGGMVGVGVSGGNTEEFSRPLALPEDLLDASVSVSVNALSNAGRVSIHFGDGLGVSTSFIVGPPPSGSFLWDLITGQTDLVCTLRSGIGSVTSVAQV
jgi:hypothetical protein